MTVIRFHVTSSLTPAEGIATLTDFAPGRAGIWPGIDAQHFDVHELGENWAEVTEGNAAAWERVRYEWDLEQRTVAITTHDSKLFGPGGGWTFQFTPEQDGTRVDVELTRTPASLTGKLLAALLPLIGPSSLAKSFRVPLKTA